MANASAESIREAVRAGEYGTALGLWQQYTQSVATAGPTPDALAEAADLIEWARPLIRAARAHSLERLNILHAAGAYGGPDPIRPSALFRASF
jgi:hypothetical protein